MNRRKKKKQQVDHLEQLKAKLAGIDWKDLKQRALAKWNLLPRLHQRALDGSWFLCCLFC